MAINSDGGGSNLQHVGPLHTTSANPPSFTKEMATTNAKETSLRQIWATVLQIDFSSISREDNFLRLGGNSVTAMHLVAEARKRKLKLSVRDILIQPSLKDLALLMTNSEENGQGLQAVRPFSLLKSSTDKALSMRMAADACDVPISAIEDIYPCTALQQGLLAMTLRRPGDYVSRAGIELHENVDILRFKKAWQVVSDRMAPILRTRIIDLGEQGLVQVVLKTPIAWIEEGSAADLNDIGLGTPLTFMGISSSGGRNYFTWVQHHAVFDGWSRPLLFECMTEVYQNRQPLRLTEFPTFLKYLDGIKGETDYWKQQLLGFNARHFPDTADRNHETRADEILERQVENILWPQDTTSDAVTRSAWALLLGLYSESADVTFGVVVSGRQAEVTGIERLAGPTIATVPVRISVDKDITVSRLNMMVQQQAAEMVKFEQTGLQAIRHISDDAAHACDFRSLLVIQPPAVPSKNEAHPIFKDASILQNNLRSECSYTESAGENDDNDMFNTYPLSLHCQRNGDSLFTRFVFDSNVISKNEVERISQQFEHTLKLVSDPANSSCLVQQLNLTTQQDLAQIWKWNEAVSDAVHPCVHQTISQVASQYIDCPAISAWDGDLTYGELEELSTKLAYQLVQLGVSKGSIVPLYFQKSIWMPVSALAVMKAGGASVFIDPSQAISRVRYIMELAESNIILCGSSNQDMANSFGTVQAFVVCRESVLQRDGVARGPNPALPQVQPDDLLYVVFTSGSTGNPKGVMISHRNFGAAIELQREAIRIGPGSRVADFCSYAFDVSWSNLIHTLANGGCLCIPSEQDKQDNFVQFLIDFKVTWVHLIPSVAAILDLDEVPTLELVALGGELIDFEKLPHLQTSERVLISYGPAECTVTTTAIRRLGQSTKGSIGRGIGAATWVVDPDRNCLAPIGSVGELVLEGPLVGQGYLRDAQKTAAAFIEDPSWLLAGPDGSNGRRGKLYKTGDLVRYTDTGELIFIGRKDTQVKIRGQRTELSDIEHHLYQLLKSRVEISDVVVDLVTPAGQRTESLIAFLCINGLPEQDLMSFMEPIIKDIQQDAKAVLPSYMIPNLYAPVAKLPRTPSGKTDRKALRKAACGTDLEILSPFAMSEARKFEEPASPNEIALRSSWANVLNIPEGNISRMDNFFLLGGDSIVAMRLSAILGKANKRLLVPDMFKYPTLAEMSTVLLEVKAAKAVELDTLKPFSQIDCKDELMTLISKAAEACSVEGTSVSMAQVEDIFPCTALQEGLVAMTLRNPGHYVQQLVAELRPTVNIIALQLAWERIAASASVLRTRIVDLPGHGMMQVVLREPLSWRNSTEDEILNFKDIGLGTPLSYFYIKQDQGRTLFSLVQHHAVYDGWSLALLQRQVETLYRDMTAPVFCRPMKPFVEFIRNQSKLESETFWKGQFHNISATRFPSLPSKTYQPKADKTLVHSFQPPQGSKGKYTQSAILRAAWSILLHWHTRADDVIFGAVVSGRQAALVGVENIVGSTIATVPICVRLQGTVDDLLNNIQKQASDMVPHEQFGLQSIRRVSSEASMACDFQTLLLIQPTSSDETGQSHIFSSELKEQVSGASSFNTYAMMITCSGSASTVELQMSFDSNLVEETVASTMLRQFQHIFEQLVKVREDTPISALSQVSDTDILTIASWNQPTPEPVETCVHDLFYKKVLEAPDAIAVDAWDGRLTYGELDRLSTKLAQHLTGPGICLGLNDIVPIYSEKSLWVPVAVLGVMKTGAASVLLDTSLPNDRLQSIVSQVSCKTILTSASYHPFAPEISNAPAVAVEESLFGSLLGSVGHSLPVVPPSSLLYIVFTSGSTGTPKGATITHTNFASAVYHQQTALGFDSSSRVYDYISYAFDVAWSNLLHTLTAGACLCIPSEEDRSSNIEGSACQLRANFMHITPSIGRLLDPRSLPGIDKVLFIGEALKASDVARWAGQGKAIYNTYGPAECSVTSTICRISETIGENPTIGRGFGSSTWIVHPGTPNRLAALGTVGELWLQGPIVGSGYLGNAGKTAEVFLDNADWVLSGAQEIALRKGGRFYRTGDLAYYDPSGSIVFVGRKDTQAKLNGQRMELGEVEINAQQILTLDPSPESVAEIIVPDVTQSPSLALFIQMPGYISGASTDKDFAASVSNLRNGLLRKLPKYMVPTIYIPISAFPMTPSGKTDRKALRVLGNSYIPPALIEDVEADASFKALTKTEEALARIWSSLLGTKPAVIKRSQTFEQLGGDSIKTVSLAMAIRKQWNIAITLSTLLGYRNSFSELAGLIDRLCQGDAVDAPTFNLEGEFANLAVHMAESHTLEAAPSVFLTGATGFLGIQILRYLLAAATFKRIVLLVRPTTEQSGMDRVRKAAQAAGWWQESFATQLEIWDGDLSRKNLGLGAQKWESLCGFGPKPIEAIIHNGAQVHWTSTYESLKAVNVNSTVQLLQAAILSPAVKNFVYVSGGLITANREWTLQDSQSATGYDQTKYISEKLVHEASLRSKACKTFFSVVKPGAIIGDIYSGIANPDDFLWRMAMCAAKLGFRPLEPSNSWLTVSDVRHIAGVVVSHAAGKSQEQFSTVKRGMPVNVFWDTISKYLERPLQPVSWDQWMEMAKADLDQEREAHVLWPVQDFLGQMGSSDDTDVPRCTFDVQDVAAAVRQNVSHLRAEGYLNFEASTLLSIPV